MTLSINHLSFQVGTLQLRRSWEADEIYRVTTEDGKRHRKVRGVYPSYSLTLGNVDALTYDRLIACLTTTEESQTVRLPDGQEGFLSFDAMFTGITDELLTERSGIRHWDNLTVTFTSALPLEGVGL